MWFSKKEVTPEEAHSLGAEAYDKGCKPEDNPFPPDSTLFHHWNDGFSTKVLYGQLGLGVYRDDLEEDEG